MKSSAHLLSIVFTFMLFSSCSKSSPSSTTQNPTPTIDSFIELDRPFSSSPMKTTRHDTTSATITTTPTSVNMDNYEEGYLDGESLSEEDRLSGHPGAQVGIDDDEEDYEEGYDDGYEE